MYPSYNHNFPYAGHTFHVQTEVSGAHEKALVTHLFLTGDIIATVRTALPSGDAAAELTAAMQQQHKDAMRSLLAGAHDSLLKARGIVLAPKPQP